MLAKRGRNRWLAIAKSFDVSCEAIVFPVDEPLIHAQRRFDNDVRGHNLGYWQDVAIFHAKQYVEPSRQRGLARFLHFITFEEIIRERLFDVGKSN